MSKRIIENRTFDEERALYCEKDLVVRNCRFDGPADGESALKECERVAVEGSFMNLRYPFWHDRGLALRDVEMTELCRAALWYCRGLSLVNCRMEGCDLAFERSHVTASITTPVLSVKNPLAGSRIELPAVGEVIRDVEGATGVVEVTDGEGASVRASA